MESYSFASYYDGPPLDYSIPRAIPLDLNHIPVASASPSTTSSSIPVVLPLPSPKPNTSSTFSPTSVIETGVAMDRSAELTDEAAETSGPVGLDGGESKRAESEGEGEEEEDDDGFDFRSSGEESGDDDEFVEAVGNSSRSKQRNNPSTITFQNHNLSPQSIPLKKSSSCSNCHKGNRFTEKESCLSCSKKYCSNCVLSSMGSMPEGRKCITCIGLPISEKNRDKIGKSSRLLRRILSRNEVEQAMRTERECGANRERVGDVFVNGQRLGEEEMANLQNCPFPPGRIKGGDYWYDKVSGYWGKMGQKPCKIISPNLHVGGELSSKASNGNTGICINGREITKSELKMLKWAGVQCAGKPQFWVNSDGSYLEEGQKKIIGHLWNKPIVKLLCPVLSLPTPANSANPKPNFGEKRVDSVRKSAPYYAEQKSAHKFLLVGSNGSGTSTIFKQAKFLYKTKPFSEPELEELKTMIQSSVYKYLAILLEGREVFEEEFLEEKMRDLQICSSDPGPSNRSTAVSVPTTTPYSITSNSLRGFSDWLLKVMASGNLEAVFPAATREYAPRVEELWNDSGIQASFKRRDELEELPASAGYFLQRTGEICRADYEPSNNDILQAEGLTLSNGVASADIIFPHRPSDAAFASDDSERQETLLKYQLIRIQSKGLNANNKWLDLFDEVRIVIFCVSLTDYNQFSTDSTNKMIKSRDLFAKIVTHPNFEQTNFLLVLNKSDLLDEKLEKSPLSTCEWFSDFAPLISSNRTRNNHNNYNSRNNNSSLGQIATHYIGVKFKRYFSDLTSGTGKRLYVLSANSLDSNSVDFALRYAKEILNWEDEKPDFGNSDSVYTMTEPTEYSN
ncbi:hypothetical protein LUZ60_005011 [Juncus effusus]|nr:hypothetical protein LUZ60_005011 [Juncus effusus]